MFKFDKNSGTVKIWVTLILGKIYELEDVPELFNLKEAVTEVFNEMTGKIAKVEPKKEEAAAEPTDLMSAQPTAADMMTGAAQ